MCRPGARHVAAGVACVIALLFATASGADDEVLDAVAAFGQAYRTADVDTLDRLLTEDYVHTNSSSSPIDRTAWLGWVATRRDAIASGRLAIIEYENTDLRVVRHGSMAIVTGRNRTVAEEGGDRRTSALRFTMVWVKTEAGWKRAAFQDCRE